MIALYSGALPPFFDQKNKQIWEQIRNLQIAGECSTALQLLCNLEDATYDHFVVTFLTANTYSKQDLAKEALIELNSIRQVDFPNLDIFFLFETAKANAYQLLGNLSEVDQILASLVDTVNKSNQEPFRWDDVFVEHIYQTMNQGNGSHWRPNLERLLTSANTSSINLCDAYFLCVKEVFFQATNEVDCFKVNRLTDIHKDKISRLYDEMLKRPELDRFKLDILQRRGDFHLACGRYIDGVRGFTQVIESDDVRNLAWSSQIYRVLRAVRQRARAYEFLEKQFEFQRDNRWADELEALLDPI